MSKLIQKAGFLSPKRAGRYMNYIATRDGVELLDENADSIYMRYIAARPRVEKHGEHGLFGAEDTVDLEKTMDELKAHEGNVWTIIYSLRREDAARLGYDNAASWRALLRSKQADFAEAMQIPPSQLRWYAAFHDEGNHPHIHMMLWSDDPKYGFLRKDKLLHLQSALTNMIYADELKEVYVQKDVAYREVAEAARAVMRKIVNQLEIIENPAESIQQKLLKLALELCTVSGKKQYGYSYLMYIEDRTTYQCHASYRTIGSAVNMSPNTVRKYVTELVERGLIQTEHTTIITQDGRKQNGSLLYTLLPIQSSIQQFYEQKLAKLDAEYEQERIRKRLEAFQQAQQENVCPPA